MTPEQWKRLDRGLVKVLYVLWRVGSDPCTAMQNFLYFLTHGKPKG